VASTPDGRYLISAGDDKAVRVWDLKENKAVRTIRRQSGPCNEGKIDRSPTGAGCSARMAVLIARGLMAWGAVYRARSIIGSECSSAGSRARPRSAAGRALCQLFRAGPGLPVSVSICWTRPIRGRQAAGYRIHGRALGRQFERSARFARLS
jgi:Proline racemase